MTRKEGKTVEFYSLHAASYIANLCEKNRLAYNNTKIQKLLYCAYGCFLVVYKKRLCDEHPRAWKHGPVFPRVFAYINKRNDILTLCPKLDVSEETCKLLEDVVKIFGQYSASALSAWTHKEKSPWDMVVNIFDDPNGIIPDHLIAEYFRASVVSVSDNDPDKSAS